VTFSPGNKLDCFPFFDLLPSLIFAFKGRLNRAEYRIINTVCVFGEWDGGVDVSKKLCITLQSDKEAIVFSFFRFFAQSNICGIGRA
jgi:hypothetical protein